VEPEAFELIAESAAELNELVAFIESAGLELVAVVAYAIPRRHLKLASEPAASAA
jgi:hypothetical protein